MNKFKRWLAGVTIAVSSALSIHHIQPPEIQSEPHIVLDTDRPVVPEVSPAPPASPTPVAPEIASKAPMLQVGGIGGANDSEVQFVKDATDIANRIMASDCFKQKVLTASFTENDGLANQDIWDLISAKPMTVKVVIYNGSWKENYIWKTMGYEDQNHPDTAFVNRHFISTKVIMGSLEVHEEEGHGNGFHHYDVKPTSVPYQFNDFIESCALTLQIAS